MLALNLGPRCSVKWGRHRGGPEVAEFCTEIRRGEGGSKSKFDSIPQDGIKPMGGKAQFLAQAGLHISVLLSWPPKFWDPEASMCLFPCLNCHLFTLLVESEDCALVG